MVAKITFPTNLVKALNYHEQKVKRGEATCLHAANYLREVRHLNFYQKRERLEQLMERNGRAKIKLVHVSLNFDPSEHLSRETFIRIANTYMEKLGFAEQPYLVYEHRDKGHEHIHILTTCIREDGTRINTHLLGANKSEPARIAIEAQFGLVRASDKNSNALKVSVKKRVDAAIQTSRNLPELIRALKQVNIGVTLYHNDQGLLYGISLVDLEKHAVFKGSKLGKNYTVASILKRLNQSAKMTRDRVLSRPAISEKPSERTASSSSNQPLSIGEDLLPSVDALKPLADGLGDLLRAEEDHSGVPFELRRKKRKKKKRNNKL